jgi:hypothetical protein
MAYAPGDRVHVAVFGKGIVREVRNGGILVEVKGRAMVVAGGQLTLASGSASAAHSRRRRVAGRT